jgi:hypothetical protein
MGGQWISQLHTLGRDEAGGRLASGLDRAGGQAGSAEGSSNGNHGDGGFVMGERRWLGDGMRVQWMQRCGWRGERRKSREKRRSLVAD